MQSVLQLVFSTSMLTILMSSNGLSFLSVLAFSIVMTTSLPLVTYKQRNTYIVPIHVLNTRYLQHMICNVPCSSRECQEQHNSSKRVKEGHTWQRLVDKMQDWQQAYPAKDCMLVVQPGSGHCGDEELAAIGVGTSIGHTESERAVMPQAAVKLILELCSPDGCAPRAIPCIHPSLVS